MDFPFVKEALSNLFSRSSCAMYPSVQPEAPEGYRGKISYHPELCINCGMCERVCAGGAITRTTETLEDGTQHIHFCINLGSCTFCATCSDFCSRNAIELTGDYHMAVTEEEELLVRGTVIKPPKKPVAKPAPKPAVTE